MDEILSFDYLVELVLISLYAILIVSSVNLFLVFLRKCKKEKNIWDIHYPPFLLPILVIFVIISFFRLKEKYLQDFINQKKSVQQIEMKIENKKDEKIIADKLKDQKN